MLETIRTRRSIRAYTEEPVGDRLVDEDPEDCELMAVIALGRPAEPAGRGSRKPLDQVVLDRK